MYDQDAYKLAELAAKVDSAFFHAWCCTVLSRSTRKPGVAHLLQLPDSERVPVARLLLHAAASHYYAVESACQSASAAAAPPCSDPGSHAVAGPSLPPCDAGSAWPYEEPCEEPLFAALRPQHQMWLITDILLALWSEDRSAGVVSFAFLSLKQDGESQCYVVFRVLGLRGQLQQWAHLSTCTRKACGEQLLDLGLTAPPGLCMHL